MLYTVNTVRPYLIDALQAGLVPMIHGRRGTGKSDLMRSIAAELFEGRFIDTRAPNHEPQDIAGLPAIDLDAGAARLLPLDIMPNEARDGATGLWAMDEVNRATRQMQSVLLGLILDGYAGGYRKPDGWRIIAAGNLASERAFVEPMDPALKSRFEHFYIQADLLELIAYGEGAGWSPAVLAFLRHAPDCLYTDAEKDEHADANPRSWEQLSRVLHVAPRERWSGHAFGKVGRKAGERFAQFLAIWGKLPPLPVILADPDGAPVPAFNEPGLLYALQSALSRAADLQNIGAVVRYLGRLPREFAIAGVVQAARRDASLRETPAYIQWALANQDVTL
jgi:hypothetical protein